MCRCTKASQCTFPKNATTVIRSILFKTCQYWISIQHAHEQSQTSFAKNVRALLNFHRTFDFIDGLPVIVFVKWRPPTKKKQNHRTASNATSPYLPVQHWMTARQLFFHTQSEPTQQVQKIIEDSPCLYPGLSCFSALTLSSKTTLWYTSSLKSNCGRAYHLNHDCVATIRGEIFAVQ